MVKPVYRGGGPSAAAIIAAWLLAAFMAATFFMAINLQLKEYCATDGRFAFNGECVE